MTKSKIDKNRAKIAKANRIAVNTSITNYQNNNYHPIQMMTELELLEMELEWQSLVDKMNLTTLLGDAGFDFSAKMFKEAYSIGYVKAKS